MSRKSEAKRSTVAANNHLGGAKSTKKQRRSHLSSFINFCFESGFPLTSMKEATFQQVFDYLIARGLKANSTTGTLMKKTSPVTKLQSAANDSLHNILASIRRAMRALGTNPDELGITSKNLGLAPRNRQGKKMPLTDELFESAVKAAIALGEVGFSIALRIERYFGHRGQEALMSTSALKQFALEARHLIDHNQMPLNVEAGTKGGLARKTVTISKYARESLETIRDALVYLSSHKFLVEGKKTGLKSGRNKYHAIAKKVGLVGQFSPHSARYRYAVDKIEEFRDAGISRSEALALCAKFLGHGPMRTQFVSSIYGKTVVSTYPKQRRSRTFKAAIAEIDALMASVDFKS